MPQRLPTPAMRIEQGPDGEGRYGVTCHACGQWSMQRMMDVIQCPCGQREFGGHVMREFRQRVGVADGKRI